jgi:hypothetical protein
VEGAVEVDLGVALACTIALISRAIWVARLVIAPWASCCARDTVSIAVAQDRNA